MTVAHSLVYANLTHCSKCRGGPAELKLDYWYVILMRGHSTEDGEEVLTEATDWSPGQETKDTKT